MDEFSTGEADVIGAYATSITVSVTGQVPTTGVVTNASGEIAGTYGQAIVGGASPGKLRAFLDRNRTVTTFDGAPDAQKTLVRGIDAAGDVIGVYVDGSGVEHGYVFHDDASTPFDVPGATSASTTMVDAADDLGGHCKKASGCHDFVDRGGALVTIPVPASATCDVLTAIETAGDVAGTCIDAAGEEQVYVDTAAVSRPSLCRRAVGYRAGGRRRRRACGSRHPRHSFGSALRILNQKADHR